MGKLDRLRRQSQQTTTDITQEAGHLQEVANEYDRVAEIYQAPTIILSDIERDFEKATELNGVDITFLFLATALQCVRQYVLSSEKFRFQDDIVDGKKKKSSSKKGDEFMQSLYNTTVGKVAPPDWKQVLFRSVPYDAIKTGKHTSNTGLSGTTHRYRTLGHDPILGWIFGTANIMTNSLTKTNLVTYQVKDMKMIRRYPKGAPGMMKRAVTYSMDDPKLLGVSVARQAIHFGSDYFTKQGLPIPIIATVDNDLAKKMLSEWHIDAYSVTRGMTLATFINQLVYILHGLLFAGGSESERKLYEAKTRKILSYSNIMASASNVIAVAVTQDAAKLDVGGLAVTLYRLISDYQFIKEVKLEFMEKHWYDVVVGEDYSFMKEDV